VPGEPPGGRPEQLTAIIRDGQEKLRWCEELRPKREATMRPMSQEMTITDAAEFLDVPRSLIVRLIKRGELPCRMVGKHRHIPSDALLAYREHLFQQARRAADEMSRLSQDLGLYDRGGPSSVAP
jgi:excisionase family DNA binding protein